MGLITLLKNFNKILRLPRGADFFFSLRKATIGSQFLINHYIIHAVSKSAFWCSNYSPSCSPSLQLRPVIVKNVTIKIVLLTQSISSSPWVSLNSVCFCNWQSYIILCSFRHDTTNAPGEEKAGFPSAPCFSGNIIS